MYTHTLVTGGCGFIGSHVVDALIARGDRVTILDDLSSGAFTNRNPKASFVKGDIADAALVEALAKDVHAIVHLAAIASVERCENEPEHARRTNIIGTEMLFAAAATRRIPIIYASSAAVYGDNPNLPLSETAAPTPLSNYGRHKLENEAIAKRYATQVPSTGLRFFNVYGPRQDPRSPYSGVISIFAAKVQKNEPLTFYGDGEQTRDFIYVGDIVRLILIALDDCESASVYNGCTGLPTSLKQLAEALGTAIGTPVQTQHAAPRIGDIRHSLGNPETACALLGFTAKTPLAEGLKALMSSLPVAP